MIKILKLSVIALILSASSNSVFAQEKPEPKEKKESNDIIIHKKADTNEKLTIVIDGDKVTVNGKPIEDYKSDNVDIIRGGDDEMPFAFTAPMAPNGEMKLMGNDFMREVHSNKAFLGVMTKEGDGGAEITEVTKESPAEKAGLKQGDVITKIDNDKIEDADDLYKAIGDHKPGEKVNVTYKRNGKENATSVELTENKQVRVYSWKNSDNDNFNFNFKTPRTPYIGGWNGDMWNDRPRLGIQVQDTEDGKGVKVLEVGDEEPADKAGLKEDDIITQVNGKNVTSVDDLKETMKTAKKGDTIKMTYMRDGKTQTAEVKFPKELKTTDL
jgi:serine protease Do